MKNLIDLDLDIFNLLKDFPINDEDGIVYLRTNVVNNNTSENQTIVRGTYPTVAAAVMILLSNPNPDFAWAALDGVANFLADNKKHRKIFIDLLNKIDKSYNKNSNK